jgi:signal transduction histidine kinase
MSSRPPKILYVEDNPMNRDLVRRILTRSGYVVVEAQDGLSGIQVAQQERPDLILMDIMLPGMDGYQVTTKLKSLPELAHTPIVALTAKAMASDRERALIAGCDGYIPKPIDVEYLREQIAEFLGGKREEIEGDAEERLVLQQEYAQELVVQLEEKVRELQKVNAELRRIDKLKSEFISVASHELRTPLAVIQGYLTMLLDLNAKGDLEHAPDETVRLSLAGIAKGAERLKGIMEDMLDVTRIEGQTLEVHREPTVVKEAVIAVVRRLEPAAKERGLTVEMGPMDGLPILRADARRLQQAFFNLLSNAIKYTPDGGKINILAKVAPGMELARRGRPTSSADNFVEIVFEDTGIGIDPEEQEHIFDLFYEVRDARLHSTSKTHFRGGGLGLGLAIVRGIVEAHGGSLWVESEGQDVERCPGSRFHVLLPIKN